MLEHVMNDKLETKQETIIVTVDDIDPRYTSRNIHLYDDQISSLKDQIRRNFSFMTNLWKKPGFVIKVASYLKFYDDFHKSS